MKEGSSKITMKTNVFFFSYDDVEESEPDLDRDFDFDFDRDLDALSP